MFFLRLFFLCFFFFFFSSRRRHTRSYGDWSSDVCSSDLDWVECQRKRSRSASSFWPSAQLVYPSTIAPGRVSNGEATAALIIGVFVALPALLSALFWRDDEDRKSTRLNSSHRTISYAVFC